MRTRTRRLGAVVLGMTLMAGLAAPAGANGVSLGPAGTHRPPEPAGLAFDAATADRCDYLDPHACLLPFPSDHFTRRDPTSLTGRRLNFHVASMPRNAAGKPIDPTEWNRNDGFSPGQSILVKVPEVDPAQSHLPPITDLEASLEKGSGVVVINAETGERHPVWAELDGNVDGTAVHPKDPPALVPEVVRDEGPDELDEALTEFEDGYRELAANLPDEVPDEAEAIDPEPSRLLIIRPAVNWDEGARYIVALQGMRRAGGSGIEAERIFRAYRDRAPTPLSLFGVGPFEGRRAHMEDLFSDLKHSGVKRKHLYLAWDFTVASEQNLSERMLHMRDESFRELGGGVPAYEITSVTENPSGDVLRRIQGTFDVPRWVSTPTTGARMLYDPEAAAEGRFLPLRQPTPQPATFTCNIPVSAVAGDGSVNPAKPSLYGHGLLGSQSEVNSGAQTGMGRLHNFAFCATDWLGMAFEDVASVATALLDMSNFQQIPDRVQQGMLNFLWLGRLITHADGFVADPAFQHDGAPLITRDLVYMGNSQGGIIGGSLTAFAQDWTRAILGVPGMNYSTLLGRSVDYDPYEQIVDTTYPDEMEETILYSLIQILWDRGEANGYAHHLTDNPYPGTPEHQVILEAAFGDHQVANVSAEVEARTIGARVHVPPPALHTTADAYELLPPLAYPATGSALMEWDSGTLAPPDADVPPDPGVVGPDPHGYPRADVHARRLRDRFLRTGEIIDVCTGSGDVPGDGWTWPAPRNDRDLASCRTARYQAPTS
ncbi:MAG: hypothetical protein HYU28_02020 [Actinobacteria bacterium]|nr:hypothetical protein [Actinomycetota bacterium]